jgi:CsoR family transcriptional regulator, copper-sensing transcriptional repressor
MKMNNPQAKQNLLSRLRRIEGQVRGVASMVEGERDCQEVLQQLTAIRSAVQGASLAFLQEYASACLLDLDADSGPVERQQLARDLVTLLGKAP